LYMRDFLNAEFHLNLIDTENNTKICYIEEQFFDISRQIYNSRTWSRKDDSSDITKLYKEIHPINYFIE
ncbi:MAG: hypothetical protein MHPSP_002585, partial [Paramarteilia canceri]